MGLKEEITVNNGIWCSESKFEISGEYLVFADDITSNYNNPRPYADSGTGRVYSTNTCLGNRILDQDGFDVLALEFIQGEKSQNFSITDTVERYNYTLYGRHTDGIVVKELQINPNWGISLAVPTAQYDKDELMELTLPKNVIDGASYYDTLVSDYSTATDLDLIITNETHNTVIFVVPAGTHSIQIKGTSVVPEFSSMIGVITAVAVTGVVLWSTLGARE
jgi:hypothetical protein